MGNASGTAIKNVIQYLHYNLCGLLKEHPPPTFHQDQVFINFTILIEPFTKSYLSYLFSSPHTLEPEDLRFERYSVGGCRRYK